MISDDFAGIGKKLSGLSAFWKYSIHDRMKAGQSNA
jgi:hypothetical protein